MTGPWVAGSALLSSHMPSSEKESAGVVYITVAAREASFAELQAGALSCKPTPRLDPFELDGNSTRFTMRETETPREQTDAIYTRPTTH